MKIAFIHYNLDYCGVISVIRGNITGLKKAFKNIKITLIGNLKKKFLLLKGINYINIAELGITKKKLAKFKKNNALQYINEGIKIYEKLKKILKNFDCTIIENPIIGLHPPATYAFYRLSKDKSIKKLFYRIHDFPYQRQECLENLKKFDGKKGKPYWHNILFPSGENPTYMVLNSHDSSKLKKEGIKRVFLMPDLINEDLLQKNKKLSENLKREIIKNKNLEEDARFLLYPVRTVPRKNIEEAIFLTLLLRRYMKKNFYLIVTLTEKKLESGNYAHKIINFVKKHKLPVIIGLNLPEKRLTKKNKIISYSIGDAYNICDAVITTSTLEGFGLLFIESWNFGKSLIGRDIPKITIDFKKNNINLQHLYKKLLIGKKDFKDINNLKEKLRLSLKLKDEKFKNRVIENNKKTLMKIKRVFYNNKIIKKNKEQVIKNYSQIKIAHRLMNAIKTCNTKL